MSGAIQFGSLAQLVEHLTFNQVVVGSNPAGPTILTKETNMNIKTFIALAIVALTAACVAAKNLSIEERAGPSADAALAATK